MYLWQVSTAAMEVHLPKVKGYKLKGTLVYLYLVVQGIEGSVLNTHHNNQSLTEYLSIVITYDAAQYIAFYSLKAIHSKH